jgi:hypothetical protein
LIFRSAGLFFKPKIGISILANNPIDRAAVALHGLQISIDGAVLMDSELDVITMFLMPSNSDTNLPRSRLKTRTWLNRGSTVAEIRSEYFLILNRPIRFIFLIPVNAVNITDVPTCGMLSNWSQRDSYRN